MLGILSPISMSNYDKATIDNGVSQFELMKRAALSVINHIPAFVKTIGIYVGSGNNGGDGIAIAYLLQDTDYKIDLILLSSLRTEAGDYYFEKINKNKINIINLEKAKNSYDCIIDCIFGNGLSRDVEGIFNSAIQHINKAKSYKISVDIPSGLSGLSGLILNNAVIADKTIAIQSLKFGHVLQDSKDVIGTVSIEDIGIQVEDYDAFLVEERDVLTLFNKRKNNTSKNDYGRVTVIGGSKNFIGAPRLAEMGVSALRTGAGLATLAIPKTHFNILSNSAIDSTIFPLADDNGDIIFNEKEASKLIHISDVIAFGMGIGKSQEIEKLLLYILENFNGSIVIDADGIDVYKKILSMNVEIKPKVVLTPHLKEFSRLTNLDVEEIKSNPVLAVKDFAKSNNVIVLLKGPGTIISDGTRVFVSNEGTPAQAKGGNGDVLSGVIAATLVNTDDVLSSVAYSSFLVGLAAKIKSEELTEFSLLASDIPNAIKFILNNKL